jgi:hypothetical protein
MSLIGPRPLLPEYLPVRVKIDAMSCDLVLLVGHRSMVEMQLVGVRNLSMTSGMSIT